MTWSSGLRHILVAATLLGGEHPAAAQVRPPLANVAFGPITFPFTDKTAPQNVCTTANLTNPNYSVLIQGSGAGLSFATTNGTSSIPFEVQWAQSPYQSSGTNVVANTPLTNQRGGALLGGLTCGLGGVDASLIVIVRAAALLDGTAGSYSGTLDVLVSPQ